MQPHRLHQVHSHSQLEQSFTYLRFVVTINSSLLTWFCTAQNVSKKSKRASISSVSVCGFVQKLIWIDLIGYKWITFICCSFGWLCTQLNSTTPLLIVGLGNPGAEYIHTRHNIGFVVIDALARKYGASLKHQRPLKADIASVSIGERQVILAKPTTYVPVFLLVFVFLTFSIYNIFILSLADGSRYMNLSGQSVTKCMSTLSKLDGATQSGVPKASNVCL